MIDMRFIQLKNATIAFDKCINKAPTVQIARALYEAKEAVLSEVETLYDVRPIKHGHWIIKDDVEQFIATCSVCGRTEDSRDIDNMPYCHCGAKMDGGTRNE